MLQTGLLENAVEVFFPLEDAVVARGKAPTSEGESDHDPFSSSFASLSSSLLR